MRPALKSWSRSRIAGVAVAAIGLGFALWLALHHPVSPLAAVSAVLLCFVLAAVWRDFWLMAIPAALPWLDFSPWTGWLVVSEFDLFLCAVFAGAYLRMAWPMGQAAFTQDVRGEMVHAPSVPRAADRVQWVLLAVLALTGLVGVARGLADAGGLGMGWYQGYADPMNSVRVGKSLLWGLLSVAVCRDAMGRDAAVACSRMT